MTTTTTRRPTAIRYQRSATAPAPIVPNRVLRGDALAVLRRLPAASVDACVTSPPYFLLRRYGAGPGEVGTEQTVGDYVAQLVTILDEVARVLTPTGTCWLNLGDSFSRGQRYGTAPKSLLLAPERLVLALSARGWIVRNRIVWAKPNGMPNSVPDRFSTTHETVFLLVRQPAYYFDLDAVREPHRTTRRPSRSRAPGKYEGATRAWAGPLAGTNSGLAKARAEGRSGHPLGRNPGDVWTVATAAYKGAHHAVFPERLVTRPILAGCPERVCIACSTPWRRPRRRDRLGAITPDCPCGLGWRPGIVLDPFLGSGTVGVAAEALNRDWLGIELNPAFAALAETRIAAARKARAR